MDRSTQLHFYMSYSTAFIQKYNLFFMHRKVHTLSPLIPGRPCAPGTPVGPLSPLLPCWNNLLHVQSVFILKCTWKKKKKETVVIMRLTGLPTAPCGPTGPRWPLSPYRSH